jgi:RHS repeat-associated protein
MHRAAFRQRCQQPGKRELRADSQRSANQRRRHRAYTQKERDADTGNDYFFARYYSSAMGRWMRP